MSRHTEPSSPWCQLAGLMTFNLSVVLGVWSGQRPELVLYRATMSGVMVGMVGAVLWILVVPLFPQRSDEFE